MALQINTYYKEPDSIKSRVRESGIAASARQSLGTAHQLSVILLANRPTWGMYYKILRIPFYGKGGKLSRNLWINFLRNRFTLKFGKIIEN